MCTSFDTDILSSLCLICNRRIWISKPRFIALRLPQGFIGSSQNLPFVCIFASYLLHFLCSYSWYQIKRYGGSDVWVNSYQMWLEYSSFSRYFFHRYFFNKLFLCPVLDKIKWCYLFEHFFHWWDKFQIYSNRQFEL